MILVLCSCGDMEILMTLIRWKEWNVFIDGTYPHMEQLIKLLDKINTWQKRVLCQYIHEYVLEVLNKDNVTVQ